MNKLDLTNALLERNPLVCRGLTVYKIHVLNICCYVKKASLKRVYIVSSSFYKNKNLNNVNVYVDMYIHIQYVYKDRRNVHRTIMSWGM